MATTTRGVFQMRIPRGEADVRDGLQALADEAGKSQSAVVRDLVREAVAARRAAQMERWGPRLFGTAEPPNEAA